MIIMADKTKSLSSESGAAAQQGMRSLRIGRPVLQKATSSAESLISNAPGTGVSQTSILTKKSDKKVAKKAKAVVFTEPLTLPSPTNPNKPPIIHQQLQEIHSESNSPIPSESDSQLPRSVSSTQPSNVPLADELIAPIASPESFKIRDSFVDRPKTTSSCSSPEKDSSSSRRSIDISNPVLKSEIDLKMNLIPINSPFLAAELSLARREAKAKTTDDFSSPRRRNSSKARPVSIAIFSPVRPKSPPPPCPAKRETSSYNGKILQESDYQCDLLQEILLEADKKVESQTGETHLCSSIIAPSGTKKSGSHPTTWL